MRHIRAVWHHPNRYDHLGRRVQKITPEATHTYFYDGWMLIKETRHPAASRSRKAREQLETRHPAALQSGSDAAGSRVSMEVDEAGSRVSIEEDVIEYHWGKDLSGTIGGAGGVGGLLYVKINGDIYVPWYDACGNIIGYWDAEGHIVAEYTYDAFGKLIASSGPMANVFSFRYSTKYFDSETGFYYYGRRFYSPELKRWITRDPIGEEGGVNLYCFCGNAAAVMVDSLGNVPTGATFLNAYKPYDYSHKASEIWRAVGGTLKDFFWSDETKMPPNTCATRISIALIKSNEQVSNRSKQFINTVKKNGQGIPGNYIVNAAKMQDYLMSAWGTASVLSSTQAYYFKSKAKSFDIARLRKEIEEKLKCSNVPVDNYVCVVSSKVTDELGISGHIGVVTKTYDDEETPYKDNPVVWILPPTKRASSKQK